jgi:hypothetical protein
MNDVQNIGDVCYIEWLKLQLNGVYISNISDEIIHSHHSPGVGNKPAVHSYAVILLWARTLAEESDAQVGQTQSSYATFAAVLKTHGMRALYVMCSAGFLYRRTVLSTVNWKVFGMNW